MPPGLPLHRRGPRQYRPLIIAWTGAECDACAEPVEHVVINEAVRVAIDRRPHRDGTIAARIVGPQMHGYKVGPGRPVVAGYTTFREHATVCPAKPTPPHEQGSLFDTTEGNA